MKNMYFKERRTTMKTTGKFVTGFFKAMGFLVGLEICIKTINWTLMILPAFHRKFVDVSKRIISKLKNLKLKKYSGTD